MASPFPALVPSSARRFAAGQFPNTRFAAYSGKSSRVRNSNVAFGAALGLTFAALSEADLLLILAHYDSVSGSYDGFNLSSEALSGVANVNDYSFTGSEWVYLDPPSVEDLPCGGHNVTVTLESLPPINVFAAGLDAAVTMQFLAPVAATTSGLSATVALSLLSGVAAEVSALGLTRTVALSLAAGSPGVAASVSGLTAGIGVFFYQLLAGTGGLTQSVTLSFAPGAAVIGEAYRYWRFDQFTHTAVNVLEIGEFVLVDNGVYVSSGSWSQTDNDWATSTALGPAPTDGVLTSRAFQISTSSFPNRSVAYDHGSGVVATGFKYASYFQSATRYITGVRVRASNDNMNFATIKTFAGMTAYSANNGNSVDELSPEYPFTP
jgi:hypothetical protein